MCSVWWKTSNTKHLQSMEMKEIIFDNPLNKGNPFFYFFFIKTKKIFKNLNYQNSLHVKKNGFVGSSNLEQKTFFRPQAFLILPLPKQNEKKKKTNRKIIKLTEFAQWNKTEYYQIVIALAYTLLTFTDQTSGFSKNSVNIPILLFLNFNLFFFVCKFKGNKNTSSKFENKKKSDLFVFNFS